MFKLGHPRELASPQGDYSLGEVINLSDNFRLTITQRELLKKGLTFIPTLKTQDEKQQLEADLPKYHRRLKLEIYFKDAPKKPRKPFIGPSTWTPADTQVPGELLNLIQTDKAKMRTKYRPARESPNITNPEKQALLQLQNNKNIIVKPADKGSAIVIMNRTHYIQKAYRQLQDPTYYKKLQTPIYLETQKQIYNIMATLKQKNFINEKQRKHLIGQTEPRQRLFYTLPKIHKDPTTWTIPHKLPPGRPIVSDCGSESSPSAEYLDHFLNPLSTLHPTYLKDTYHFIQKIQGLTCTRDCLLFSMDVKKTYTQTYPSQRELTVSKTYSHNTRIPVAQIQSYYNYCTSNQSDTK